LKQIGLSTNDPKKKTTKEERIQEAQRKIKKAEKIRAKDQRRSVK
jgi:hypothetical protein